MAESIKFTDGVSRIEGASLSAPYDLRNAYIKPAHIVKALNSPSEQSGIVSQVDRRRLYKHSGNWVRARAADYYQSILYATDAFPNRIDVYHRGNKSPEEDVPRIVNIENVRPGGAALNDNRLIMYVFIPINHRGEAGVWRYKMHNTSGSQTLPIFGIHGNDYVQYVEVYRTAEMRQDIHDSVEGVQSLHYLGRFGSDTASRGSSEEYYTSKPPLGGGTDYENDEDYHDKTSLDYIYLSHKARWAGPDHRHEGNDVSISGRDLVGWRVVFRDLHETGMGLSEDTDYFIASHGDYKIFLEDDQGNALSFDGEAVQFEDVPFLGLGDIVYEGVRVDLLPPPAIENAGSDILVIDGKQWEYDTGEESSERPNQPESRILERDRTLHGRTRATDQTTSVTSSEFVVGGDRTDIYTQGKVLMYDPGTAFLLKSTFGGEVSVGGDATLTLRKSSGGLLVILKNISLQGSGDVQVLYEIKNGTAPYTVELKRRVRSSRRSGTAYTTQSTDTVQSAGTFGIAENAPKSGTWEYLVSVTDDTSTTVRSGTESIEVTDDDEDDRDRGPRRGRIGR